MREEKTYAVYILASKPYGTLYIGVTGNLIGRIGEHRDGLGGGFTSKYRVTSLVWYEWHSDIRAAIQREKTMKHWRRSWKINLIESGNPHWADLFPALLAPVAKLSPVKV